MQNKLPTTMLESSIQGLLSITKAWYTLGVRCTNNLTLVQQLPLAEQFCSDGDAPPPPEHSNQLSQPLAERADWGAGLC